MYLHLYYKSKTVKYDYYILIVLRQFYMNNTFMTIVFPLQEN